MQTVQHTGMPYMRDLLEKDNSGRFEVRNFNWQWFCHFVIMDCTLEHLRTLSNGSNGEHFKFLVRWRFRTSPKAAVAIFGKLSLEPQSFLSRIASKHTARLKYSTAAPSAPAKAVNKVTVATDNARNVTGYRQSEIQGDQHGEVSYGKIGLLRGKTAGRLQGLYTGLASLHVHRR